MILTLKLKKIKRPRSSKHSERKQKALQKLKARDDIVVTNADRGVGVVILDV